MSKPSLAEVNPELAKQWHPTKNGELTPGDVTHGSHKKVWWKCEVADDHEWEASVKSRSNGNDCSCCRGLTVVPSNCLATLDPQLASQWHPSKNDGLTPFDVTPGSRKKVWWKCEEEEDHEWTASPNKRAINGCPCCSGYKVVNSNCLATLKPKIAEQWHPTKNGKLTPSDVTSGSNEKVWWKCNKADDHEWAASILSRSNGNDCSCCRGLTVVPSNCLATLDPQLASQWHPSKNDGLTPFDVTPGSRKKVWWKCEEEEDHEWEASVKSRYHGSGCPCCSGYKVVNSNCLATLKPKIAEQWHPTKNGKLTPSDVTSGSNEKVWWKCNKADDHEWDATIEGRANGRGCPCCDGKKVVSSNCLATLNPELAREWHPTKNGDFTPNDITPGSKKIVWWKCDKADDHEWEAQITSRSRESGCPCCSGKKVVPSNCLTTLNPKLAGEWHPTKNGDFTPNDITPGSKKIVWWKCDKADDHEWTASILNRSRGSGCPWCTLTPQSKQELIITFELMSIFKNIHPKGFKTRLDGRLRAIDIFIPLLKLAIEFDGSFWHKDKKAIDKIKSEMLMDEGYQVIRIREEPLKKIHENDIISILPYNGKQITDDILKRILELYDLDSKTRNRIEIYLREDSLQNEKELDSYIDQILTEKVRSS